MTWSVADAERRRWRACTGGVSTYREKAVLLAIFADFLLGDGCGRRRVLDGLGNDARAVVLRGNVRGCGYEVGHG